MAPALEGQEGWKGQGKSHGQRHRKMLQAETPHKPAYFFLWSRNERERREAGQALGFSLRLSSYEAVSCKHLVYCSLFFSLMQEVSPHEPPKSGYKTLRLRAKTEARCNFGFSLQSVLVTHCVSRCFVRPGATKKVTSPTERKVSDDRGQFASGRPR